MNQFVFWTNVGLKLSDWNGYYNSFLEWKHFNNLSTKDMFVYLYHLC